MSGRTSAFSLKKMLEAAGKAYEAAELLHEQGVNARVVSMHTIKPLDSAAVLQAAEETAAIITVEEHSSFGGLGEACAAVLMQAGKQIPFTIIGIPDVHPPVGSQEDCFYTTESPRKSSHRRQDS